MSWKASAWAKDQRLGSPAAKSILMCLADGADAHTNECWPSQATLADEAEVSERTAREWLQRLEDWGLIERQRRTRATGARASDRILLRLDVRISDGAERCRALKDDGSAEGDLPAEIAGRSNRQSDAEPTGNEAQPTGNEFRASKEEPPIEPPTEPLSEGAQARERGSEDRQEDRKKTEQRGWALLKDWPGFAGMPKEPAMKAWLALDADAQDRAERRFAGWLALLKAQRKSHVPAPATYFRERLFDDVADPQPEAEPEFTLAPAFGPGWAAARFRALLAGPSEALTLTGFERRMVDAGTWPRGVVMLEKQAKLGFPAVNRMNELAEQRRGVSVGPAVRALEGAMEPVPVGSAVFQAWRAEHERRGWPWIADPGQMRVVFFPRGGPEGLGAFAAMVTAEGGKADRPSEPMRGPSAAGEATGEGQKNQEAAE